MIGVGSIDPSGVRSPGSEVGTFVKIVAPGGSVVAQRLPDGLAVMDGTSFAVPYVAATAALVRQAYPRLSGAQVAARILATADPPVDGDPGREDGSGVADPYRAVTEVLPASATEGTGSPGSGSDQPGARTTAGPGIGPSTPPGAGPSARPGTQNGHRTAPGAVAGSKTITPVPLGSGDKFANSSRICFPTSASCAFCWDPCPPVFVRAWPRALAGRMSISGSRDKTASRRRHRRVEPMQ